MNVESIVVLQNEEHKAQISVNGKEMWIVKNTNTYEELETFENVCIAIPSVGNLGHRDSYYEYIVKTESVAVIGERYGRKQAKGKCIIPLNFFIEKNANGKPFASIEELAALPLVIASVRIVKRTSEKGIMQLIVNATIYKNQDRKIDWFYEETTEDCLSWETFVVYNSDLKIQLMPGVAKVDHNFEFVTEKVSERVEVLL
ncbi:MAG: hypothetical protein WCK37_03020 [Candidatus Falkowbacteria bacterium]